MRKFNVLYDSSVEGNKDLIVNTMYGYKIEEIEFIDINDIVINESEKYYSILVTGFYIEPYFLNYKSLPIPHKTKNLMRKHKNVFSVFLSEHESDNDRVIICLEEQSKNENLNTEQIILINGNEIIDGLVSESNSKIKVHTSNRLPLVAVEGMNTFKYNFEENRKNTFMCFNRMNKCHRLALLVLLRNEGILDEIDWSLLRGNEIKERYINLDGSYSYILFLDVLDKDDIKKYKEHIDYLVNYGIKNSINETDYKIDEPPYFIDFYKSYEMNPYKHSYVNLVTETSYHSEKVIHITEKSLIPFYYSQIGLILGSCGHNERFKEKYQLDMFEDIIDYSFDKEKDNRERLFLYFEQVKKLKQIDFKKYFSENKKRFESNMKRIKNIVNDKKDYNFFKSLI